MTLVEPPALLPATRPVGEDEAATVIYHRERERLLQPDSLRQSPQAAPLRSLAAIGRLVIGAVFALYLFMVALQLLAAGAAGFGSVIDALALDGGANLLGAGWLLAYGALSGSPVAALAVALLEGGAVVRTEALAMLAGSRLGASLVVLLVGAAAYMGGRRSADGLYVGVVALLTTITIYVPALPLARTILASNALDGAGGAVPRGWAGAAGALAAPVVGPLEHLPAAALFACGMALLIGAFWLFDRLLPNLDPPPRRLEALSRRFHSTPPMFALGALITLLTLSVSLSLTILVPLTLKGLVRRGDVVPYVLGANITTFVDTLFAALLLESGAAVPVVLSLVFAVTAVSLAVLTLGYRPYSRAVLWAADRSVSGPRGFTAFLLAIGLAPLLLIAV